MFTVTIKFLVDGFPRLVTYSNVKEIKTTYDKTLLYFENEKVPMVFYYVIKVKSKLQMETGDK